MRKVCDDKLMDLDYVLALYPNEDPDCLLLTMIDIRNAGYPPKENCIILFNKVLLMYRMFGVPKYKKRLIRKYYATYHKLIKQKTINELKMRKDSIIDEK